MTHSPNSSSTEDISSPSEFYALIFVGTLAIPIIAAFLLGKVTDVGHWLVARGILAPAADDPMLSFSFLDHAGLDTRRLVLAVAAFLVVAIAVNQVAGTYKRRRQIHAMRQGDIE